MSELTYTEELTPEEILKILEFHFLTKNYSKNYLASLTEAQLRAEYQNYIQRLDD